MSVFVLSIVHYSDANASSNSTILSVISSLYCLILYLVPVVQAWQNWLFVCTYLLWNHILALMYSYYPQVCLHLDFYWSILCQNCPTGLLIRSWSSVRRLSIDVYKKLSTAYIVSKCVMDRYLVLSPLVLFPLMSVCLEYSDVASRCYAIASNLACFWLSELSPEW